jgi:AcrR family transcriptional regulator
MASRERGRPPMSSVAALEDAATELFLEQGYQNTSIDEIARRAGISRATFFNYFTTKSDVLWVDVDSALPVLNRSSAVRCHCVVHSRQLLWPIRGSGSP